jgi:cell division protein FtsI (penicillin-binding protein 3)
MPEPGGGAIVSAALREREAAATMPTESKQPPAAENLQSAAAGAPGRLPSSGTVVLDVEQGGVVVPSFAGKSVRGAIELAEDSGLDLDAVGSGMAREQSPSAGSHVATGSRVTVKFGR